MKLLGTKFINWEGIVHFRVFPVVSLTSEFAACSKLPSRDNHRKAP